MAQSQSSVNEYSWFWLMRWLAHFKVQRGLEDKFKSRELKKNVAIQFGESYLLTEHNKHTSNEHGVF